jgi:hypothetical protein
VIVLKKAGCSIRPFCFLIRKKIGAPQDPGAKKRNLGHPAGCEAGRNAVALPTGPMQPHISYSWWGTEVRKTHKQLYPASRLVFLLDLGIILVVLYFLFLIRFWVFENSTAAN